jgi:hypothetical protein
MFLAFAAPVAALGGLWWLVTAVLLAPGVPDGETPAPEVVRFIMHEKGLPRLGQRDAETFFRRQAARYATDTDFRDRFGVALTMASPEGQTRFHEHLFDVFKPMFMKDIEGYFALSGEAQATYLDERIVAYNCMSPGEEVSDDVGVLAPSKQESMRLLLSKTTQRERELGMTYFAAIGVRVQEILADADLKASFERRIAEAKAAAVR